VLCATTQIVLCPHSLAALEGTDLRSRTRAGEPKDQECKFAKRTHLNHVKSFVCVFQD
jgi:hypothetical protein